MSPDMINFKRAMEGSLFGIPFSDPDAKDLKKEEEDWRLNLCLNGDSNSMARGYFFAAHTMAELLREDNGSIDIIAYPILFNYRHGTEIYLKNLIERLSKFIDGEISKSGGHEISKLWAKFDHLVDRANFPDLTNEHRRKIESCCRYIVKFDPDGQTWRYAFDTKGVQRSRLIGHHTIHLGVVQKAMATLYHHLAWVDELLHQRDF